MDYYLVAIYHHSSNSYCEGQSYTSQVLNNDYLLWHTQLIVFAEKYQNMVQIMDYYFHFFEKTC